MEKREPIKRNIFIQPLSRDHHFTLLLCWKIRKGFSKNIPPERIKRYADWYFQNHVLPHFQIEEDYLFPVLGKENDMVKKALSDHRRLTRLFRNEKEIEKSLSLIEEELEQHVRYEERELFNEIQRVATPAQLELVAENHPDSKFRENTEDEFWL